jgi:plasmid maintenance system killer protein
LIRSFRDKDTESIFHQRRVKAFQQIAGVALRRLVQIDSAEELRDLASPPANRLEALKGDRAGNIASELTISIESVSAGRMATPLTLKSPTIIEQRNSR